MNLYPLSKEALLCNNGFMNNLGKPTSPEDAISASPLAADDDLHAWQVAKLAERRKRADEGHFSSAETVRAVIRKFIPNG
ncbi:hypothetical protein EPK99_16550 [Neorhizobium lilium]|uniref:Uncharacterized protein n=2 Tax=Neorhizobium lilium TaxID=2503024 RepID=A0A444LGD7_9HYPH|nr:hypothetical protein EPK99_16550 [Neorhizobium lilium]